MAMGSAGSPLPCLSRAHPLPNWLPLRRAKGRGQVPRLASHLRGTILIEAIWIVLGRNKDGEEVTQGTAFGLHGIGIVSAAHVFEASDKDNPPVSWEVAKASSPSIRCKVNSWLSTNGLDLAVVDADAVHTATLRVGERQLETGDEITIAGFPNWFSSGDGLEVQSVKVTQRRVVHGVSYILTNANIRRGASGGPMLDESGFVVGLALAGAEAIVMPNGGLAIHHLKDLSRMADIKTPAP